MLIEIICSFACSILSGLFSVLDVFSLPYGMINGMASVLQYGSWVVGSDVLLLFTSSVVFWWGVKASTGIAIWAYEHLPFIN